MRYGYLAFLPMAFALSGCATQLSSAGAQVKVVTEAQREKCSLLTIISTEQSLGPDKPGNALRKALNEVAGLGGNGFRMISSNVGFDGASVTGEALKCEKSI
ncbi:hypothetical protein [Pseudomonas carnis]|uniref:hypothetical protein n=1 Tax=Pseudomonas carnis TaxID=2487355 RepID=UPI0019695E88|nr:hypothetical protein [Pseudomonas carnis]